MHGLEFVIWEHRQERQHLNKCKESIKYEKHLLNLSTYCYFIQIVMKEYLKVKSFSLAIQYIITLLITVLRGLGGTCGMKIDEETIDEKATSMSSVMSSLLIFPLLMHLFMYV